jgi:pimeloyl-ACP methyl ester carboxylesterase
MTAVSDVRADDQQRTLRRAADAAGLSIKDFSPARSRHEVVAGHRLHLLDWGTPGSAPVVFLHGTGLTAHTWDLVALALRSDHHCFAVDLRGHGDSEWSPTLDYRVQTHARDVLGLLESGAIPTPCHLVGMSLGGVVALTAASLAPGRVASTTVIDIGPETFRMMRRHLAQQDDAGGGAGQLVGFLAEADEPATLEEHVARAVRFNPRRDPELLRASLLHNLRPGLDGRLTWKYDRRQLAPQNAVAGGFEDPFDTLGDVRSPVLVVRGGQSPMLSAAGAEELTDRLDNARWVEVADAGHSVQGDNPAQLVSVLREHLLTAG